MNFMIEETMRQRQTEIARHALEYNRRQAARAARREASGGLFTRLLHGFPRPRVTTPIDPDTKAAALVKGR